MIRNIIFDWSGTLVDDLPAVLAATNFVFAQCGVPAMSLERFRAEFCLPFKDFYDRFAPGVPMAELERTFHRHFRQLQEGVTELPHAREFLVFCRKQRLRTFVLSTMHPDYFALQAAETGFDQYIERSYPGVLDKRARIVELLGENQLSAAETLFIGDMQHDIETAKHGGVHSCAVLTGYNRLEQLRASEPDRIVGNLGQLREFLEGSALEWRGAREEAGARIDQIIIKDLEVFYRAGVTEEERAKPQRLLLTVEMERAFAAAARSDDLEQTIDYYAVAQRLKRFGDERSWKLIETLSVEIASMILNEFAPQSVTVEVKKFALPEAAYVSARVRR